MTADDLVKIAAVRRLAASGRARRIRLDSELSLAEVGLAVGVAGPTIYRWEVGENAPRGAAAVAYCDLLNDLSELRGRSRKAAASR